MTSSDSSGLADRLSAGTKALFSAQVLSMGANALLVLLLTRVFLDPEEFGRLFFALAVLGFVSLFATLGVPKSTARYVTEYLETDDTQVRYVIRQSLLYLALLVGVVCLALAATSGLLARLLGEPAIAPLLLVGSAYVAFYSASGHFSTLFQGFNRVTLSAVITAVSGVGRLVFAVGFVLLGLGAIGVMLGYVAGSALAAVVGGVVLYRRYYARLGETERPESGLTRRLLEYSVPLTVTKGANVLDKRVDTILVGLLLNPTAVGYYVVAKQISDVVSVPAGSFGYTISPAYGEQRAGGHVDRAARLYENALTHVLLFYVPACAGVVLVAEPTVRFVFGPDYAPAAPVVQVFAGFILVNAVNKITNDGLDYLGRARSRAVIKSSMAVANFLLNLLLIPVMGVIGAAVATVMTYTVYTLGNVYIINQDLTIGVRGVLRDAAIVCAITLGMAAAVVVLLPYVSGISTLLGVVLFGGAVWALLSVMSGLLDVSRVAAFFL